MFLPTCRQVGTDATDDRLHCGDYDPAAGDPWSRPSRRNARPAQVRATAMQGHTAVPQAQHQLMERRASVGSLCERPWGGRVREQHAKTKQKLEGVKFRIAQLRQASTKRDEIKVATVELRNSAEVDYEERRPVWSTALRMFTYDLV